MRPPRPRQWASSTTSPMPCRARPSSERRPGLRDLNALNVRDFLEDAARAVPDETFLIPTAGGSKGLLHGQESISYREFNRRVDVAACAWHELGVRKGDRVAFMLENRPEFLQAWLGLAKIGAILVACNTRWQAAEVAHFLALAEPRVALVSERYREVFRSAMPAAASLEEVLTLGPDEHFADFYRLLQRARPEAPADRRGVLHTPLAAGDVISFISTSGTTGRPKAVMQTHGNYVLTGEGYAHWVELRPGER